MKRDIEMKSQPAPPFDLYAEPRNEVPQLPPAPLIAVHPPPIAVNHGTRTEPQGNQELQEGNAAVTDTQLALELGLDSKVAADALCGLLAPPAEPPCHKQATSKARAAGFRPMACGICTLHPWRARRCVLSGSGSCTALGYCVCCFFHICT